MSEHKVWAVVSDEGRVQSRHAHRLSAEREAWQEYCRVEYRPSEADQPTDIEKSH